MNTGRVFVVYGGVQGVGFRYQTFYWAKRRGVTGTVQNRADGTVRIEAFGTEAQLAGMQDWLDAGGPPGSRITDVISTPCEFQDVADFRIRHD